MGEALLRSEGTEIGIPESVMSKTLGSFYEDELAFYSRSCFRVLPFHFNLPFPPGAWLGRLIAFLVRLPWKLV